MFEPIGGSAPKYTGQGIINPMASICAGAMMLDYLGQDQAAAHIEEAVAHVCSNDLKSLNAGEMGYSTLEVSELVAKRL